MGNWLSIAVAVFLAVMVLFGHYKGFIRLAVSAVSLIATLFVVQTAMPHVTNYLKNSTGVYQFIVDGMKSVAGLDEDMVVEEPSAQRKIIEELELPKQLKDSLLENNNYEAYNVLGVNTFKDYISGYLANVILNIAGFLVMFVLVYAILHFITAWLDLVARLPILSGINKVAGALLGAVEGMFILWLLCLLVTMFAGTGLGRIIIMQIEASTWLTYIYEHNLLGNLVIMAIKSVV